MPSAGPVGVGLLDRRQSLLVIVDLQTRLLAAMQPLAVAPMLDNTEKLLRAAALLHVPVLVTEQYPKGLGASDERVTAALPVQARRFEKTAFSACGCDGFKQALAASGCRQIVLTGQETHVCVLQTAFDLMRLGFQVCVVEDAVCSRSELHKANALRRMRKAGIGIVCYESVLFEWLRDAAHPDFKAISALIR